MESGKGKVGSYPRDGRWRSGPRPGGLSYPTRTGTSVSLYHDTASSPRLSLSHPHESRGRYRSLGYWTEMFAHLHLTQPAPGERERDKLGQEGRS